MKFENTDNALKAEFRFKNFITAIAFINEVAEVAEQMNHHPEWSNIYNKVAISLTTHDSGNTVTQKDYDLAEAILTIAERHNARLLS